MSAATRMKQRKKKRHIHKYVRWDVYYRAVWEREYWACVCGKLKPPVGLRGSKK